MSMLILNGSPKGPRSNTMCLTRAFAEGTGWTGIDTVDVLHAGIGPCRGCFACWRATPGQCVQQDGMGDILARLLAAEVVVWSFPLYYFGVPGPMKNLIDRQLPLLMPAMKGGSESGGHPLRHDLSRQRHVVISTCGFWTAKGNYDSVTAMFDRTQGAGAYAAIFCGQGELFHIAACEDRTAAYLSVVRQAGAEYAQGGIRPETQRALTEPLYPRDVFEKGANASWGPAE